MNPPTNSFDFQVAAIWLLGVVMSLLSFLGLNLWTDVKSLKEKLITRDEFNTGLDKISHERDVKHTENTGNFRRLEEKIDCADQRQNETAVSIERRLGEILVEVAKARPQRHDGPERRRY